MQSLQAAGCDCTAFGRDYGRCQVILRVADVREAFVDLYKRHKAGESVEVAGTLELVGATFVADEDTVFGQVNHDYLEREQAWYLSQSRNVYDIPGGPPKIWRDVSSTKGEINSNYGWTVFSAENGSQIDHVIEHLIREPEGRRAVMIYTRPTMHTEWNRDGMRDFMCTSTVAYYLRNGLLHSVVQMRSSDVTTGLKNDLEWQRYVQALLCTRLEARGAEAAPGDVIWQAGSLHIYSRNYWLLEHFLQTGEFDPPLRKFK